MDAQYQIIFAPEASAILQSDFSNLEQRQIIRELQNNLSYLPKRFPKQTLHRANAQRRIIKIGNYGWAFAIKNHTVYITYGAPTWRI